MNSKKQANSTPRVYTSKSGRRYARTSEVLCSGQARSEIGRYVKLSKASKTLNKSGKSTLQNK